MKSTANELWNGWKLAWYHNFTHIACAKKLRGSQEELDALRVQTDNLFRSIRVSDENSSVTKGFQFFKHIWTQDFFCVQYAPFKATSSLFKPFLPSFAIFHALHDLFWAKMTLNWKALQMRSEVVENWHGIIISPT